MITSIENGLTRHTRIQVMREDAAPPFPISRSRANKHESNAIHESSLSAVHGRRKQTPQLQGTQAGTVTEVEILKKPVSALQQHPRGRTINNYYSND